MPRNHHHMRVSSAKQMELIEDSLACDYAMLEHVENCQLCNDDDGICLVATELYTKVKTASKRLKRIGLQSGIEYPDE